MSSQHTSTSSRADLLRKRSLAFCQSLLDPPPPPELLAKHFSSIPEITEHGPSWAIGRLPFLGTTFSGVDDCHMYFVLLSQTLKMHMDKSTFPDASEFIVDEQAVASYGQHTRGRRDGAKGAVSVVGKARFESVKTGKSWKEQFIYRLSGFDEEGNIGHWEIWADPLSAWEAVGDGV